MEKCNAKIVKPFSSRKVSADKAIKLLSRRGIHINEEEAVVILDFLYLLASSFRNKYKLDGDDE